MACKLDNLRSLPLVCRLRHPQISGFTFRVISRSQFNARRYFSDFSLRCVSASLLSHLKLTILASFSDTFGAVFSVSVSDCAISSSKESPLSSPALSLHVESLLSLLATYGHLFAARSLSASDSSVSESSLVNGDFRFLADSAVVGARVSPLVCSNLSDLLMAAMFVFSWFSDCRIEAVTLSLPLVVPAIISSCSSLDKASS